MSHFVAEALAALDERCDLLLINTPPVLAVGDAMTVAKHTDAVILVARVNRVRRETLVETRHVLDGSAAMKLGVIATVGGAARRVDFAQPVARCAAIMPGARAWSQRRAASTQANPRKKFFPRSPLLGIRERWGHGKGAA